MPYQTCNGRTASVYLPTRDVLIEWQNEAAHNDMSVSEYIYEQVQKARLPTDQDKPRPDLARKVSDLEASCRMLEQSNKLLQTNLDLAEAEVYKLRHSSFAEVDEDSGMVEYDREMLTLLQKGKTLTPQEILASRGIDPRDRRAVKLVANQLEELRRFGLVKETMNGWRWI